MSLVSRPTRQLAILAWPALIAALVVLSVSSSASACPLRAERRLCAAVPGWSACTDLTMLVCAPCAAHRAADTAVAPRRSADRRTANAAPHTPLRVDVLAFAPKTSPPR